MSSKRYFEGLNTLRAIAAIAVFIGHVELIKFNNGVQNYLYLDYFKISSGHTGVVLFFVLSGFLITYLLLEELSSKQKISFINFYKKRILRVWPLYFLIILLSLIVFNYQPSVNALIWCVLIFPNIAHSFGEIWLVSPQIWSIGVEEQFYLLHPLMMTLFQKKLGVFLLISIFLLTILPQFIICYFQPNAEVESFIHAFAYGSKYNCMLVGALAAYYYYKYPDYIKAFFKNKILVYLTIFIPFLLWLFPKNIYLNDLMQVCYVKIEITQELFALLFSIMILAIVTNFEAVKFIKIKFLDYIGKISYGFYMFHWFVISIVLWIIKPLFITSVFWSNSILYLMSFIITIAVSHLSFHYFENFFAKFRPKY